MVIRPWVGLELSADGADNGGWCARLRRYAGERRAWRLRRCGNQERVLAFEPESVASFEWTNAFNGAIVITAMPSEPNPNTEPSSPLFAAIYDPATALVERTLLGPHREYLVANLDGTVLDLGAGTGAMFAYFDSVATASTELHATEPDRHMRRQAAEKAKAQATPIRIESAPAEALPYADATFDAVIASMVFCTIPDVESAVSETARVLKPGGELRFFEHVIDDGWRARVQTLLAPLWKRVAGGCHLTRQTGSRLVADRSFDVVEIERFNLGVTPVRPFIRGTLRKRAASPTR